MDELSEKARQLIRDAQPKAFKVLAQIADDPKAKLRDRANAQKSLKRRIPQLRALCTDPSLSAEDKHDLEAILKKFEG